MATSRVRYLLFGDAAQPSAVRNIGALSAKNHDESLRVYIGVSLKGGTPETPQNDHF